MKSRRPFTRAMDLGIEIVHRAGFQSGIISGRIRVPSRLVRVFLGMEFLVQGCENKVRHLQKSLAEAGVTNDEVAYIGDDLNDIPLMMQSGLGVAVADAVFETRERAHYVTKALVDSAPSGK